MSSYGKIKLYSYTIDCKQTLALAKFYAAVLGWELDFDSEDDEYVRIYPPGTQQGETPCILFQRNEDYVPPVWPEDPPAQQQMAHLDLAVTDLAASVEHAVACGATISPVQFSNHWTVLFDPQGHPFCLCLMPHAFTQTK